MHVIKPKQGAAFVVWTRRQSLIISILVIFVHSRSLDHLAHAKPGNSQSSETLWTTTEHSPTRSYGFTPEQSRRLQMTSTPGAPILSVARNVQSSYSTTYPPYLQQALPKSLKFTLTAGKYWKFNISKNSLQSSQPEKELRLHSNMSAGNYIIDDDGWFQYNHQLQQLFAWPSMNVRPTTYYFVLIPSALDYEADGENVINSKDIVANIVVELIKPHIVGVSGGKIDLNHLIDHKMSLEFLHRHSSYPLLLTQIVSVFDLLARASVSTPTPTSGQYTEVPQPTTLPATTAVVTTPTTSRLSVVSAVLQNKNQRSASKFNEYLLIDSKATEEGEFFSITWTTHPTLINNTIVPINDCRLSTINDTLSKLSKGSILYPAVDDKFVISYALEGPLVSSQAIIPTERGNYALKLSLHNACRSKRALDELGITSAKEFPLVINERENKSPLENVSLRDTVNGGRETSAEGDTISIEEKQEISLDREHAVQPVFVTTDTSPTREVAVGSQASKELNPLSTALLQPDLKRANDSITLEPSNPPTTTATSRFADPTDQHSSSWQTRAETQPTPDPLLQIQTTIRRALGTSAPPNTSESSQQQPKLQPQAKSLENFLDSSTDQNINSTLSIISAMMEANSSLLIKPVTSTTASTLNASETTFSSTTGKSGQESSLNDDLIGIFNEVTEFIVSIAIPVAVVLGVILFVSLLVAMCNLYIKKKKSKQFEIHDRFKFRYGSERKGFLKKSSKPVILEADQKSLSMGGTPRHQPLLKGDARAKNDANDKKKKSSVSSKLANNSSGSDFFAMSLLSKGNTAGDTETGCHSTAGFSGG